MRSHHQHEGRQEYQHTVTSYDFKRKQRNEEREMKTGTSVCEHVDTHQCKEADNADVEANVL